MLACPRSAKSSSERASGAATTAGISLAEHGADVLMVTAPDLPEVPAFVRDTSHGKRSTFLDFTRPQEAARLRALVRTADVFIDGYRPHRLAAHGFGASSSRPCGLG